MYSQRTDEANAIDPIEQEFLFCEHYETANIEQRNLIAVSYTHLDVYKRQSGDYKMIAQGPLMWQFFGSIFRTTDD